MINNYNPIVEYGNAMWCYKDQSKGKWQIVRKYFLRWVHERLPKHRWKHVRFLKEESWSFNYGSSDHYGHHRIIKFGCFCPREKDLANNKTRWNQHHYQGSNGIWKKWRQPGVYVWSEKGDGK